MKIVLIAFVLGLVSAEDHRGFHERYGIPNAARIKKMEESMDFDSNRITGGSATSLGAHPHLAGLIIVLESRQETACGGSLLNNRRVVTAAHCWRDGTNSGRGVSMTVVLGSLRLFSGGTRIRTTTVAVHASYNPRNLNNDIAMITISFVAYTNNINRIALPSGNQLNNNFVGAWAFAAGYGFTSNSGSVNSNSVQRQVMMSVITNAVCVRSYSASEVISSNICTSTAGGRSICDGDSGGPLTWGTGNNRTLIGISSFVHRNGCTSGQPAGFARVTSFNTWIRNRL